jgi:hypothetical protein
LMQKLSALYPSGAMNTAAPTQGTPAADHYLFKNPPARRAS